jgi:hypothetical protein
MRTFEPRSTAFEDFFFGPRAREEDFFLGNLVAIRILSMDYPMRGRATRR